MRVVIEGVERVPGYAPGPHGIGQGRQSAAIWFRARNAPAALSAPGAIALQLGCGVHLDVAATVQLFAGMAPGNLRGKLSFSLASSGGRLGTTSRRSALKTARAAARAGAGELASRLGVLGSHLEPAMAQVLEDAADAIFRRGSVLHEARHGGPSRIERTLSSLAIAGRAVQVEPRRDGTDVHDDQDVASTAADTWVGSGEGAKPFPEVFAGLVPSSAPEDLPLDEPRRLDVTTLSRMETFLGGDFSSVRIHTGPGAAEVTSRFAAEAVTVKDHIFFAPGRFNPGSEEGQRLLAHELTHVLQEGRSNLDVRSAENEALRSEHTYAYGAPAMETLNLSRPEPAFKLADGEGQGASTGVHTAKRNRSRGHEAGGRDVPPDGDELIELVSNRVYDLLMEELEQAFESR